MRLLADAHISRGMVAFLESLNHDVLHAGALEPRLSDSAVLKLAAEQERVVLTADKDFGELVFRQLQPNSGVVLIRLTAASEAERLALFVRAWPAIERSAPGHFVVVADRTVRRTALP